jgi:hypothetical protein
VSWVFDSLIAAVGSKLPPGLSAEQQRQEQSADKVRSAAPFSIFATKSRNFRKDASVLTLEHYARLMRS